MVTRGFFGCGITEGLARKQWEQGVLQLDRVLEVWVHLPLSVRWTQRRWWLMRSSVLML